jgi:hypothetical protein
MKTYAIAALATGFLASCVDPDPILEHERSNSVSSEVNQLLAADEPGREDVSVSVTIRVRRQHAAKPVYVGMVVYDPTKPSERMEGGETVVAIESVPTRQQATAPGQEELQRTVSYQLKEPGKIRYFRVAAWADKEHTKKLRLAEPITSRVKKTVIYAETEIEVLNEPDPEK